MPEAKAEPGDRIQPINPATGEPLAPVPCTTVDELEQIVAQARAAQRAWAATPVEVRAEALRAFAASLGEPSTGDPLARSITREMGKPLAEARAEVASVAPRLEGFITNATEAARDEVNGAGGIEVTTHWRPLGVAAVIAPWNYPVSTPNNLVVSALLTGNAVVLKPSEVTPHTGALYHRSLAAHLPEGLVGLVQGGGAVGAALVRSSVDLIAFTGSVGTGQSIMREAAGGMKRLVLELGGKDPMLVLAGADVKKAAAHAVRESTRNAGQVCVAVERVFVDASVESAFLEAVRDEVAKISVGDPEIDGTGMGPMSSARQRELVLEQLEDARRGGATFLVEAATREPGFYLTPAVVTGVRDDMRLAREETFGPVIAVSTVGDAAEAVARANDTPFGLGASVWGTPGPELDAIASAIDAGMVGVNRGLSAAGGAPWVGWKMSGYGFTRSVAGMRNFMLPKTVARQVA